MSTIAMQRARPTMISPVRYSGRSGRNSQASANISTGPMTQLSTSDSASDLRRRRWPIRAVPDLGEHRVHHQQQPDRDREADGADPDGVEPVVETVNAAEHDPGDHREPDPHRQEPIEQREPTDHRILRWGIGEDLTRHVVPF